MGKSRICNFYGELRCGSKGYTVGLQSVKEAKGWVASDNSVNGNMGKIDAVYMIPQTAGAKRQVEPYYCLKVTSAGVEKLNITDLN